MEHYTSVCYNFAFFQWVKYNIMFDVIYINFDCIFKEKISISVTTPYIDFNFSHVREIHTEIVHTREGYNMMYFQRIKETIKKMFEIILRYFDTVFNRKKNWFYHPKSDRILLQRLWYMHTHYIDSTLSNWWDLTIKLLIMVVLFR